MNRFTVILLVLVLSTAVGAVGVPVAGNVLVHLDAADASSITASDGSLDDGDTVQAWGAAFQPNPVWRPAYRAAAAEIGGMPGVEFYSDHLGGDLGQGVFNFMLLNDLTIDGTFTAFFVLQEKQQTNYTASFARPWLDAKNLSGTMNGATGYSMGFGRDGWVNGGAYLARKPGQTIYPRLDEIRDGSQGLATFSFQLDAPGMADFTRNGVVPDHYAPTDKWANAPLIQELVDLPSYTTGYFLGASTDLMGDDGHYARYYNGLMCEVLIYDDVLTASEVAMVNDYLITKWDVPEPTSMILLALGGLALRRRRA